MDNFDLNRAASELPGNVLQNFGVALQYMQQNQNQPQVQQARQRQDLLKQINTPTWDPQGMDSNANFRAQALQMLGQDIGNTFELTNQQVAPYYDKYADPILRQFDVGNQEHLLRRLLKGNVNMSPLRSGREWQFAVSDNALPTHSGIMAVSRRNRSKHEERRQISEGADWDDKTSLLYYYLDKAHQVAREGSQPSYGHDERAKLLEKYHGIPNRDASSFAEHEANIAESNKEYFLDSVEGGMRKTLAYAEQVMEESNDPVERAWAENVLNNPEAIRAKIIDDLNSREETDGVSWSREYLYGNSVWGPPENEVDVDTSQPAFSDDYYLNLARHLAELDGHDFSELAPLLDKDSYSKYEDFSPTSNYHKLENYTPETMRGLFEPSQTKQQQTLQNFQNAFDYIKQNSPGLPGLMR